MLLPHADHAGLGQEQQRDEPPYAVIQRVFTQGWYLIESDRDRAQVGLYVRLVALQAELLARRQGHTRGPRGGEPVQDRDEVGHIIKHDGQWLQHAGVRRAAELLQLHAPLLTALPGCGHLFAEVGRIEHEPVEQEARRDGAAAARAGVPPNPHPRPAAAGRAFLERDGRVAGLPAGRAGTAAFAAHLQAAGTARAGVPGEDDLVEERPRTGHEPRHGRRQRPGCGHDVEIAPVQTRMGFRTVHWGLVVRVPGAIGWVQPHADRGARSPAGRGMGRVADGAA